MDMNNNIESIENNVTRNKWYTISETSDQDGEVNDGKNLYEQDLGCETVYQIQLSFFNFAFSNDSWTHTTSER